MEGGPTTPRLEGGPMGLVAPCCSADRELADTPRPGSRGEAPEVGKRAGELMHKTNTNGHGRAGEWRKPASGFGMRGRGSAQTSKEEYAAGERNVL